MLGSTRLGILGVGGGEVQAPLYGKQKTSVNEDKMMEGEHGLLVLRKTRGREGGREGRDSKKETLCLVQPWYLENKLREVYEQLQSLAWTGSEHAVSLLTSVCLGWLFFVLLS